ncbi:thiamine-phosphate pyrophosphorylase [Prevotella dentasini]|uniref:thiamine-phosphate pyrophosphorylase n=1 Tax=Prevotella dentasini TaxID=589537 RepID=UPI000469768E|nr:thiamine-phosphate pyrophosphorylase [Prevotella dentasini]
MKLVVMTDSTFFVEEDKILCALFEEGLDNLHISKADDSPLYFERLLSLIPKAYRPYITIHQQFRLKDEYALSGIHLDRAGDAVPPYYRGRIGRTCSNPVLLREMKRKSDYVILDGIGVQDGVGGPGISDYELEEIRRQKLLGRHVYAMGRIGLDDIPLLRKMGFGGIVVRDELWEKFDVHSDFDFKRLIAYYRQLKTYLE